MVTLARQNGLDEIDLEFLQGVLEVFSAGSESVTTEMRWTEQARARIERAPESVRGMLIR